MSKLAVNHSKWYKATVCIKIIEFPRQANQNNIPLSLLFFFVISLPFFFDPFFFPLFFPFSFVSFDAKNKEQIITEVTRHK